MRLEYLSKVDGIGGKLKSHPEDFIVEEITEDGTVLELDKQIRKQGEPGKFTHFILQKRDWSTADAINQIAKSLGISHSRFNFAGTKDKRAVTVQLASVLGISPEAILKLTIKDISINGAWTAGKKVSLGALLGNRFRILASGAEDDPARVGVIYEDLGCRFPNYFGEQRFGSTRQNTHKVGEKLIQGDFRSAVMGYLADSEGEEHEEARLAREELAHTQDFKAALRDFPKHLRLERSMLAHLAENPEDSTGALKRLPRNILLLFIHAFQSAMFNELLSQRIREGELKLEEGEYICGKNRFGFPELSVRESDGWLVMKLIGYETFDLSDREYDIMERHCITPKSFRIKGMPEISSKGSFRTAFSPLKDFSFKDSVFRFSIPSGSYATMALREFMDEKIS